MAADAGQTTSQGEDGRPGPSSRDRCSPAKHLPAAKQIVRSWRQLIRDATPSPGRRNASGLPTLVACSGGADSCALLLALAGVTTDLIVGHVVHDLRSPAEACADRDSVRRLAQELGLEFAEASVRVRGRAENAEGAARRERYTALATMAAARSIRCIATAHHAQDQLESILMAVMRGAGPAGLAGIRASRGIDIPASRVGQAHAGARGSPATARVRLIRPCLAVHPEDLRAICRACRWEWREDATNADRPGGGTRSAIRARIVPAMLALRPAALDRAVELASLMEDVHAAISRRARRILDRLDTHSPNDPHRQIVLPRTTLRRIEPAVLGEVIRVAHLRLCPDAAGRDNLRYTSITAIARAIRGSSGESLTFRVGARRTHPNDAPPGLEALVGPHSVVLRRPD